MSGDEPMFVSLAVSEVALELGPRVQLLILEEHLAVVETQATVEESMCAGQVVFQFVHAIEQGSAHGTLELAELDHLVQYSL